MRSISGSFSGRNLDRSQSIPPVPVVIREGKGKYGFARCGPHRECVLRVDDDSIPLCPGEAGGPDQE